MALALDGAVEQAHHGHPDFRIAGRIFATLGYPDRKHGMVALTLEQQRSWVQRHPAALAPVKGTWGEQGATLVRLAVVDEEALGEALTLAWQNARTKGPTRSARSARKTRRT